MKMRMTNVPFQTMSVLVPNSTKESLSITEKNHAIDLTGFVIMCLDVWYGKTSNFSWFTRCGFDVTTFRVTDWSKNLGVICNDDTNAETTLTTTIRKWDAETREDIEVEFIDVDISDVSDMINWLRIEKDIFYAPPKDKKADEEKIEARIEPLSSTFYCCDSKLVTETQRLQEENKKLKKKVAEQQKKIDSYEATLSKITDIMEPKCAGPTWSETWDDLVERIKRMKEKVETLEAAKTDWRDSFKKAQDSRSAFCKKLKEALNVDYRYPGSFPKMEEDILAEVARLKKELEEETRKDRIDDMLRTVEQLQKRLHEAKKRIAALENGHAEKSKIIDRQNTTIKKLEEQLREKTEENSTLRDNLDYFANLAQGRQKYISNLHDDIDKVYCEIFDCSNGGPEGTYKETLHDILTEYKRVLELKNVAEEKTIKYKELARENEEKANNYNVRLDNAERQLRWTEEVNKEWLKKYEKLKSELDEMKELYREVAVGNGGLCEELAKEKEWTKRLEQKLIEIQDICGR